MKTGKWNFLCSLLLLVTLLGGCSLFGSDPQYTRIDEDGNVIEEENPFSEMPAKKLLTEGMDDYNVGKYFTAGKAFNEIINRYPFSPEAVLAELKAADCSYYQNNFQEAFALYENFENSHPTNESIPYIMFQKGMCYYRMIDRVDRDPTGAEKAELYFKQFLEAYPDSIYADDAKEKLAISREFLADHELFVAKFYNRTDKYQQASARLRYLLAAYPNTKAAVAGEKLLTKIDGKKDKAPSSLFGFFSSDDKESEDFPEEGMDDAPITDPDISGIPE